MKKRCLLVILLLLGLAGGTWANYIVLRIDLNAGKARTTEEPSTTGETTPPEPAPPEVPPALNLYTVVVSGSAYPNQNRDYFRHRWGGRLDNLLPPSIESKVEVLFLGKDRQANPGFVILDRLPKVEEKPKTDPPPPDQPPMEVRPKPIKIRLLGEQLQGTGKAYFPPMVEQLKTRRAEYGDGPEGLLRLADWMLQHWTYPLNEGDKVLDMRVQFESLLDELAKAAEKSTEAETKAIIQALVRTRKDLTENKPAPDDKEAARLKTLLFQITGVGDYQFATSKDGHYVLLHMQTDQVARQWLRRLEHLYAGFFYWFALKNRPLPASPPYPQKPLLCVLVDRTDRYDQLKKHLLAETPLFDAGQTGPARTSRLEGAVVDGFYSRFDQVLMFAPIRLDSPYQRLETLQRHALQPQGLNVERLLSGEQIQAVKLDQIRRTDSKLAQELDFAHALAFATMAAREEGELAALTHEGIQQLAGATGLLPRQVQLPFAVRFGLASFFETPRTDNLLNPRYPTFWSGLGAPSWIYLPLIQDLLIAEQRGELVWNAGLPTERKYRIERMNIPFVLTDRGFLAAERAEPQDRDFLRYKARTEAWALSYFLMTDPARDGRQRRKLDKLIDFYRALDRFPRDFELSDEVIVKAFAEAFDLKDNKAWDSLEKEWREYMKPGRVQLEVPPLPPTKIATETKPKNGTKTSDQ
jgi:hypothetical protein